MHITNSPLFTLNHSPQGNCEFRHREYMGSVDGWKSMSMLHLLFLVSFPAMSNADESEIEQYQLTLTPVWHAGKMERFSTFQQNMHFCNALALHCTLLHCQCSLIVFALPCIAVHCVQSKCNVVECCVQLPASILFLGCCWYWWSDCGGTHMDAHCAIQMMSGLGTYCTARVPPRPSPAHSPGTGRRLGGPTCSWRHRPGTS